MESITLIDTGLRNGLQALPVVIGTDFKRELLIGLVKE